jgi:hypothetical protein
MLAPFTQSHNFETRCHQKEMHQKIAPPIGDLPMQKRQQQIEQRHVAKAIEVGQAKTQMAIAIEQKHV